MIFLSGAKEAKQWTLIESERVAEITREHDLAATGCLDPECTIEVGRLLQADFWILLEVKQPDRNREVYDATISLLRIVSGTVVTSDSIRSVNFSDLTYFLRYNAVFHRANLEIQTPSTRWSRRAAGLDFCLHRGISNGGPLVGDSYGFGVSLRGEYGPFRAKLVQESRNDALRHPTRVGSDLIFPDTLLNLSTFMLQIGANLLSSTRWDIVPLGCFGLEFAKFEEDSSKKDGTADQVTTYERSLPMRLRVGTGLEISRNFWFGRFLQLSSHLSWTMDWALGNIQGPDVATPRQELSFGIGAAFGHP